MQDVKPVAAAVYVYMSAVMSIPSFLAASTIFITESILYQLLLPAALR